MMNIQELQGHLGIAQRDFREGSQIKPAESTTKLPLETTNPSDMVFISIDLEAFELAHHKITEIGLSSFDTRSLTRSSGPLIAPGPNASNWIPLMKYRHIRIKEHLKHVNKRYIKGCPENFDYGKSDIQSVKNASCIVQRVLQTGNIHPAPQDTERRDVVMLSHGLSNDLKFLTSIEIPPTSPVVANAKKVDTQRLCATKKNVHSLKKYLDALGIKYKNLHNAGNDAALTLQALLIMAVIERETPGAVQNRISGLLGARPSGTGKQEGLKSERTERRRKAREERRALELEPPEQEAGGGGKPISALEIARKREHEEEKRLEPESEQANEDNSGRTIGQKVLRRSDEGKPFSIVYETNALENDQKR